MLVDPSGSAAGSTVTGAIRQASQATGTSFDYLLATAQVESGFDPQAGASTSSARGLFQFVEQTWLGTMKQAGAALGYGAYADAITKTASGNYEVKDPAMRSQILKLRNDPTANAVMAGAFTQANAAYLTDRLRRAPSEGELYIAHFLGAGGAARLIRLAANNPNANAAELFPGAAHANTSIFYDRSTGAARTVAQVRNVLTARYDAARSRPGTPASAIAQAASRPTSNAAPAAPDTAGITSAFADAVPRPPAPIPSVAPSPAATPGTSTPGAATADGPADDMATAAGAAPAGQDNQIFHGLFQDSRKGPVAAVVSQLWGVAALRDPGESALPRPSGDLHDLFRDSGAGV